LIGITWVPGELDLLGNLDETRRLMVAESRPFRYDTLEDVQELLAGPFKVNDRVHKGEGSEHIPLGDTTRWNGRANGTGADDGGIDITTSILPVLVHGVGDDISEGA